ncbi:hypothetical protein BOX37_16975 [Nocardia mangyaensis]|uniref:Low molecular weight antigen MTB12-like C-terminal domain-containing protein n=1 Tax=Nocardia mangyaensis TaxID=2213200 RepID=A0A1J0VTL4_9NOCA|nr:hypothetical protein [Nocardia mangyaensis]APE35361.1 hypothetical protein BOX37_16975 [Nocardia mangyaensis]
MPRLIRIVSAVVFAALLGLGLAQPAAADVSIRDGKVGDLYVRDEVPNLGQLERQFAAFWNPNIGVGPKLEVSYNGPQARGALERVMASSQTMDFFSIQGRAVGGVNISGNTMSVRVEGVMAGFPATSTTYHFIREGGLWKYDWKATCAEMQCAGNPDFGY